MSLRFDNNYSRDSLIVQVDGSSRLSLAGKGDARMTTIAAKFVEDMGFLDKIKTLLGLIHITRITDSSGKIREVAINVNSLVKRLNIDRSFAEKLLSNEKTLDQVVQTSRAIANDVVNSGNIDHKKLVEFAKKLNELVTGWLAAENPDGRNAINFKLGRHTYLIIKGADHFSASRLSYIAEGSFGQVHKLVDISNHSASNDNIVKIAKRSNDTSLVEEHTILNTLNPNGKIEGLQLPSKKAIYITHNHGIEPSPGYIAPRYDQDLSNFRIQSLGDMCNAFGQLTNGLIHLQKNEWVHGDIKPQNMLRKEGRFDLADLGGAQEMQKIETKIKDLLIDIRANRISPDDASWKIFGTYTPNYITDSDRLCLKKVFESAAKQLRQTSQPEARAKIHQNASETIKLIMKARDAYALGLSMIQMLPRMNTSNNYWTNVEAALNKLVTPNFSTQILSCLQASVQPINGDSLTRGTIEILKNRIASIEELNQLMNVIGHLRAHR